MDDVYSIVRSDNGAYYTLTHNGEFVGNYDTLKEAALDIEEMRESQEKQTA